jgi:hypothetical protein
MYNGGEEYEFNSVNLIKSATDRHGAQQHSLRDLINDTMGESVTILECIHSDEFGTDIVPELQDDYNC